MMERRLRLAKRLLKRDGVLIVTIDEHEVNHLGMLLERLFPEYLRYMVTSVINPKGTFKQNFGRVDEQIFFVVPNTGGDVIVPRPREADDARDDDINDRLIQRIVGLSGLDGASILSDSVLEADEQDRLAAALEIVEPEDLDAEPLTPDFPDGRVAR
jgi:adenine-specific DNA-methyltransferase